MKKIQEAVERLRALEKKHTDLGIEMTKAAGGNLYSLDLLAIAALNRSVCILTAFCDLIEKRNFVAAAPLLRLQLDSLSRLQGAWLAENPHRFAEQVLAGTPIKKLKDKFGNEMTDYYLVEKISSHNPSFREVYRQTSGFIHLSEKHIFSSIGNATEDYTISMKVGSSDSFVKEETYVEACLAFFEITQTLFRYIHGWTLTKDGKHRQSKPVNETTRQ